MSTKPTDADRFAGFCDGIAESLLLATDEEILEEVRISGADPEAEAARLKGLLLATVTAYQQRALRVAREGYGSLKQRPASTFRVPETSEARRELFASVVARQPQYMEMFTTQHRSLSELSDTDIESYLEDLAELGVLDKLADGNDGNQ